MPKGFRKMAVYLGLVEDNQNYLDDEIEEFYEEEAPTTQRWSPTPRAFSTNGSTALADRPEVRVAPQIKPVIAEPVSRITTLHPRAFNDARRYDFKYKDFTLPQNAVLSSFIRRLDYPLGERSKNGASVPTGVPRTTKLWWDQ
jgi:hypothetical protein